MEKKTTPQPTELKAASELEESPELKIPVKEQNPIIARAREKAIEHVMKLGGMTYAYTNTLFMSLKSPKYSQIMSAKDIGTVHEIIRNS